MFDLLQIRILQTAVLGLPIRNLSAFLTSPRLLVVLELLYRSLDLRPQIRTMESSLVHHFLAASTIPSHPINCSLRSLLFQNNPHGVCESNRVVRSIGRQQEHFPFTNDDVPESGGRVHDFEHHGALVLIEPLGRLVDVVIRAGVGPADYHYGKVFVVDAVVVDWRFEEVRVFFEPGDS